KKAHAKGEPEKKPNDGDMNKGAAKKEEKKGKNNTTPAAKAPTDAPKVQGLPPVDLNKPPINLFKVDSPDGKARIELLGLPDHLSPTAADDGRVVTVRGAYGKPTATLAV